MFSNPYGFEDFRGVKASGKINANHPDFKSLDGKVAVWADASSLTGDLRDKLDNLPQDMPVGTPEARYKRKWEALLADPGVYEDLRAYKAAVSARHTLPDFRLAGSDDRASALWLDGSDDTKVFLERLDMSAAQPTIVNPDA